MTVRLRDLIKFVWGSISALLVILVIVAAFVVGWLLRGGADGGSDAVRETAATSQPGAEAPPQYTCSMHPQVRLEDPNAKCPICFMDLVPVAAASEDGERILNMTAASVKLAEIRTTPVRRMFPTRTVRMFGNVDYDETRIATIAAYFPGRLERLYVDYTGVRVNRGEHLADIYSPELNLAHEELRQALSAEATERTRDGQVRPVTAAKLAAAREKLRLWGLTDTQIKALERTRDPENRMTIHAPISGVVIEKKASQGAYVRTGDEIYRVADLRRLWVRLEAYESQLPWLRYGQDVEFTTDSLPGEPFHGQISFIDPVVGRVTRTIRIRLNVDNADGRLKPGMFVRATARSDIVGDGRVVDDSLAGKWICPMHPEVIKGVQGTCDVCEMALVPINEMGFIVSTGETEPPLVIPATAPLVTGRRAVVYVQVPDRQQPTFEGREVVLGPRAGDYYIVREGLEEGEDVVVHGAFKIDSALQIAAKPSMMDPRGTGAAGGHQQGARAEAAPETPPRRFELPAEFLSALTPVYAGYLNAQEALAADDLEAFKLAAADLHQAVDLVDGEGLTGAARSDWRRLSEALRADAEHRDHLSDLVAARAVFETYSKAAIELQAHFGHTGTRPVYQIFCPMAFDNRGASWLSRSEKVSNPYFGASMLRCGTLRAEYSPREDRP